MKLRLTLGAILLAAIIGVSAPPDSLESGFRNPPLIEHDDFIGV